MESVEREDRLSSQLESAQIELSKSKQELKEVYASSERLLVEYNEMCQACEKLKDDISAHKREIRELKNRENQLIGFNTELDGENVQLQEQIVRLKEQLVELDTVKHENNALEERLETFDSQIVELTTLKRVFEKQLEESLNLIREEREYKYKMEREVLFFY